MTSVTLDLRAGSVYLGTRPIPNGMVMLGVVMDEVGIGALLRDDHGAYFRATPQAIAQINHRATEAAIRRAQGGLK